jgi:uncharacterized protein (DUF427 family)
MLAHVAPLRVPPGPGQESVWDYPRPPVVERVPQRLTVVLGGNQVADTTAAWRVLETSHPPVYYLPFADFAEDALSPGRGTSFCEFKGLAAVYPARMDACRVDGAVALPQPGGFYGGWITAAVVGPFKGEPGTMGW